MVKSSRVEKNVRKNAQYTVNPISVILMKLTFSFQKSFCAVKNSDYESMNNLSSPEKGLTWIRTVCYLSIFQRTSVPYFMLSGRISRNIGEKIVRFYTGTTSENTDFHVLVA